MKMSKKVLSILLSVLLIVLTLSCLSVCFTASAETWGYVDFGTYPQTKVNETTALRNAAVNATWKSYGYYAGYGSSASDRIDGSMYAREYMQFADFFLDGVKYRAVKFTRYRPHLTNLTVGASNSYQDDNGYSTSTFYYFKYEPLTWYVRDISTGLAYCDDIIDAQAYQNCVRAESGKYYIGNATVYANSYPRSSIRDWLNEDFYNTAFTAAQKAKIQSKWISNGSDPGTKDPIFLLSKSEAEDAYYFSYDAHRKFCGTDYAECQGLSVNGNGYSNWMLRDCAHSSGQYANGVDYDGTVTSDAFSVYSTSNGVFPACYLPTLTDDTTVNPGLYSAGNKVRTVNVTADPVAGATVTGGGDYAPSTSVTLTAKPNSGYSFGGWYQGSNRVSTALSYTFTVPDGTGSINYTAKFSKNQYTITTNAGEGGTVTGGGTYLYQDSVTVKATPNSGYHFVGWYKGDSKVSADANYSFTVTEGVTLTAKFESNPATYEVRLRAGEGGRVSAGHVCPYGTEVTVWATPDSGYHFVAWYDGDVKISDKQEFNYTVTKDVTLTAKFEKDASSGDNGGNNSQPQHGSCKWCGKDHNSNFFQKIIGFFHSILAMIFGARY